MLKLLGQEADSFGKRAEMYYHTRPEVISHVEQVYRAYRALVERYDHISKELHKANHTIATACPEEVQYAMLEEEDHDFPKAITPIKTHKSLVQEILNAKRQGPSGSGWNKPPSHPRMSAEEAQEEIGRLQKSILVLQTEKEYVKSSYESGIARYREIEKQIADTQNEICLIQDRFDAHAAIGDDEARALMTITALRSCQGTIAELVRHFEELIKLAAVELEKTKSLRAQLYAMMDGDTDTCSREASSTDTSVVARSYPVTKAILELQPIYEKLDKFFSSGSESSAEEIAENVDELVDKVINLELKFPKQTAQINQLIQENENLKNKLDELQDEMALRDDQSELNEQIKQLEDEFSTVRVLERSILEEEASVSTGFSEVFSCIINISKALGSFGPEDLHNLSAAVEDGAMVPRDVFLEQSAEESKGGDFRDIEAPTLRRSLGQDREDVSEVVSDNGNDGIHGSRNANEEIIPGSCLMQQVRYKLRLHFDDHIDPLFSSENENIVHDSGEGNVDSSSGKVFQSSSETENGSRNFPNGEIMRGEYPLGIVGQTHLLHSGSMDHLDRKYDSNEASQSLMEVAEGNIDDGNSFSSSSVIQEEGLGDSKSQNTSGQISPIASSDLYRLKEYDSVEESSFPKATCFSGADKKSLHMGHADEAKSVEESPHQVDQLNGPQNIESSNECNQVGLLKEDDCISLVHVDNVHDMKNIYSSEVRDETSICAPAGDYEQVPTNSERKTSHGRELASEATTSNNHGGRSQGVKSGLMGEDFVPSWQEFLPDGLEGKEAILLADCTSVLRNYKETKRRLSELERRNQEHLEETKAVIRELRNANSMKYVEIRSLRDLLDSSEVPPSKAGGNSNGFLSLRSFREIDRSIATLGRDISAVEENSSSNIETPNNTSLHKMTRFRNDIDALVEENLQFLVRYSMACYRMQEFDRRYQEAQDEMEDNKSREPDTPAEPGPAEKKLRELRTELDVWFEQSALLDQEVQLKSASLCRMQEEIAEALRGSLEMDRARFTPYEAAKFQGEVLNMQQSTSKIEGEMQAASEHMRGLQAKVSHALEGLRESFEISSQRLSRPETERSHEKQFKHFPSRTRVPLRNFLFGTKRKKKSIFACINPTFQKQFSDL